MKNRQKLFKVLLALAIVLLGAIFLSSFYKWQSNYKGRFYPGIHLGSLDLSGKTPSEARDVLNNQAEALIEDGLFFSYGEKTINIEVASDSFDPDLSYRLLNFNTEETIQMILSETGNTSYFRYLFHKFSPKKSLNFPIIYQLEEDKLEEIINEVFSELVILPENAFFSFEKNVDNLVISPEKIGKEINYQLALEELDNKLKYLEKGVINLKTRSQYPEIKTVDLQKFEEEAKKLINEESLKLRYKKIGSETTSKLWTIKPEKIATWISVSKLANNLSLSFDQKKIANYLETIIAPEVDIEPTRPRFEIKNGKVSAWQKGINGQKIDITSSTSLIEKSLLSGQKDVDLTIIEVLSEDPSSEETYNIQEIIGTGHSNFAGSPTNRRKNIQVGAEAVNGVLLAPGEEFSLVKVLGDVSAETGYFPELVIKDNKTIPEYGGGLCQIATTIFRSALQSGLPITARRNHSYRVSYYEPAGTDAAVYIPNPDVRFINDTPNYILIQSRLAKDDIYFDFWGKKDGRSVKIGDPVVYNIVKPAPTKYIETEELAPGEKKCTEKAHNGADAYFDYQVTYPEGATTTPVIEKRFNSHYVPWREVCLIGKVLPDNTSEQEEELVSSETISNENPPSNPTSSPEISQ